MAASKHSAPRRRHPLTAILIPAALVLLFFSMLAAYISDQVVISSKKQELAAVQAQISQQNAENEELQRVLDSGDDQIQERIARDTYGYAAPNERIFVDMSGK